MKGVLYGVDCCFWSMLLISVIQAVPITRRDLPQVEGYGELIDKNSTVCLFEGKEYSDGQVRPSSDPCETCTCTASTFTCKIRTCDAKPGCKALQSAGKCCPDFICDCEKNGRTYGNGEKVEEPNPCNVCYCRGGEIKCAGVTCYTRPDCFPHYVPGRCCPKYDHCPPIETLDRSTSPSPPLVLSPTELSIPENQTTPDTITIDGIDQKSPQVGTLEIIEIYPDQEPLWPKQQDSKPTREAATTETSTTTENAKPKTNVEIKDENHDLEGSGTESEEVRLRTKVESTSTTSSVVDITTVIGEEVPVTSFHEQNKIGSCVQNSTDCNNNSDLVDARNSEVDTTTDGKIGSSSELIDKIDITTDISKEIPDPSTHEQNNIGSCVQNSTDCNNNSELVVARNSEIDGKIGSTSELIDKTTSIPLVKGTTDNTDLQTSTEDSESDELALPTEGAENSTNKAEELSKEESLFTKVTDDSVNEPKKENSSELNERDALTDNAEQSDEATPDDSRDVSVGTPESTINETTVENNNNKSIIENNNNETTAENNNNETTVENDINESTVENNNNETTVENNNNETTVENNNNEATVENNNDDTTVAITNENETDTTDTDNYQKENTTNVDLNHVENLEIEYNSGTPVPSTQFTENNARIPSTQSPENVLDLAETDSVQENFDATSHVPINSATYTDTPSVTSQATYDKLQKDNVKTDTPEDETKLGTAPTETSTSIESSENQNELTTASNDDDDGTVTAESSSLPYVGDELGNTVSSASTTTEAGDASSEEATDSGQPMETDGSESSQITADLKKDVATTEIITNTESRTEEDEEHGKQSTTVSDNNDDTSTESKLEKGEDESKQDQKQADFTNSSEESTESGEKNSEEENMSGLKKSSDVPTESDDSEEENKSGLKKSSDVLTESDDSEEEENKSGLKNSSDVPTESDDSEEKENTPGLKKGVPTTEGNEEDNPDVISGDDEVRINKPHRDNMMEDSASTESNDETTSAEENSVSKKPLSQKDTSIDEKTDLDLTSTEETDISNEPVTSNDEITDSTMLNAEGKEIKDKQPSTAMEKSVATTETTETSSEETEASKAPISGTDTTEVNEEDDTEGNEQIGRMEKSSVTTESNESSSSEETSIIEKGAEPITSNHEDNTEDTTDTENSEEELRRSQQPNNLKQEERPESHETNNQEVSTDREDISTERLKIETPTIDEGLQDTESEKSNLQPSQNEGDSDEIDKEENSSQPNAESQILDKQNTADAIDIAKEPTTVQEKDENAVNKTEDSNQNSSPKTLESSPTLERTSHLPDSNQGNPTETLFSNLNQAPVNKQNDSVPEVEATHTKSALDEEETVNHYDNTEESNNDHKDSLAAETNIKQEEVHGASNKELQELNRNGYTITTEYLEVSDGTLPKHELLNHSQVQQSSTTEDLVTSTLGYTYEISDNDTLAIEPDNSREHVLSNAGTYPKQDSPEKVLDGITTEPVTHTIFRDGLLDIMAKFSSPADKEVGTTAASLIDETNFVHSKKPDNGAATLAEILLKWLETKKATHTSKAETGRTFESQKSTTEGSPVSILSALTSELIRIASDNETVSKEIDRGRSLDFDIPKEATTDQSLEIYSKDIENLAGALANKEVNTHIDVEEPIHIKYPYTDENLAPVLSMISDQLQFLKVGEEQPIYIDPPPEVDRSHKHGIVVVPTHDPVTVDMVKVVDGVRKPEVN